MFKRALLLAATSLSLIGAAGVAQAIPAVGVVGGTALFSFDTATPSNVGGLVGITGLQPGETIYGIDYRPTNSALYGLGSSGRLYTLNATTGAATTASTVSVSLLGTSFDIAFNATVDRLRIVGTSTQDLRVNVDTGAATVDGAIAYAAGDVNAGKTPGVTAVAYTNQVNGAATTILYDLDPTNGAFTTQAPPNNGTLNTVGSLTTTGLISFDIDGVTGAAFAASGTTLYSINLGTGATTTIGNFGRTGVSDFALTPVPEPMTIGILGLGAAGLVAFRRRPAASAA